MQSSALLLALQSLATSATEGLPAETCAEEALHWGVQGLGLTYPIVDAPVTIRTGPDGLAGISSSRSPTSSPWPAAT